MSEKFSQASQRSYRVFRDQHGRKWGADIEVKTQAPCGPLSPRFSAPLIPPQKYLKITDVAAAEITIDYDQWLADEDTARAEWQERLRQQAYRLYHDKAAEAIENPPAELLALVGRPPEPRERILAARDGKGKPGYDWLLGFSDERPKWADVLFPAERERDELSFMDEGAEFMEESPKPRRKGGRKAKAEDQAELVAAGEVHESWQG